MLAEVDANASAESVRALMLASLAPSDPRRHDDAMPRDPDDLEPQAAPVDDRDVVSPLHVVGGVVGLAAIAVADVATGGLLGLLDAIPAPSGPSAPFPTVLPPPAGTAPAITDGRGNARCTGCGVLVAWSAMELDEHGYHCGRCATARPGSRA